MKLYEIDQGILNLVDPETGEITDIEAFEALQMERSAKLENLGLYYKDLVAEAAAIKAEENSLKERREKTERRAESIKDFLQDALQGETYKTPRLVVSYRKSSRVVVSPEFTEWAAENDDSLLTYKDPTPSLTAIKRAIEDGRTVKYAEIVENHSMSIK